MTLGTTIIFIIGTVSLVLAAYQQKRREDNWLVRAIFLLGASVWNISYSFQLMSSEINRIIFWNNFQMIGGVLCTLSYIRYFLAYFKLEPYLKPGRFSLLALIPVSTLLLAYTNEAHSLIWTHQEMVFTGTRYVFHQTLGIGVWANLVYTLIIIFVPGILFVSRNKKTGGLYLIQSHQFLMLSLLILAAVVGQLQNSTTEHYFSFVSSTVGVAGIVFTLSQPLHQKKDLLSVAQKNLNTSNLSGVMVLDDRLSVLHISKSFEHTFDINKENIIHQSLNQIILKWPWLYSLNNRSEKIDQSSRRINFDNKDYLAEIAAVLDEKQQERGYTITFREIPQSDFHPVDLLGLLDITEALSESISLETVLLTLAKQLVKISNFSLCCISEWDQKRNAVVALVEHSQAIWSADGGDQYMVGELPTTQKVLEERLPVIVENDQSEADWMEEQGWKRLLMLPLIAEDKCIGLVEVGNSKTEKNFSNEDIQKAQEILNDAQSWLKFPFQTNHPDSFLALAHEIKETLCSSSCTISEWRPEQDLVITHAECADSVWDSVTGPVLRVEESSSTQIALQQGLASVIHLDDLSIPERDRLDLKKWNAKTLVAFPLNLMGERIGLIEMYQTQFKTEVPPEDLLFWRTLADKAGFAIKNARLHQETEKNLQHHVTLLEVVSTLSSSLNIYDILNDLAEQMAKAIDATSSYFVTYDLDARTSTVIAEYISPNASPEETISDLGIPYSNEEWLDDDIQRNHIEIVNIDDPEMSEREYNHLLEYGGKSVVYIPLFAEDMLIGHIELWESREKRIFSAEEIRLISAIAQQAGIVLENALLYEKAQKEIINHQKTQTLLTESESYYRSLFENAHDAIILFDPKTNHVVDINDKACELYGYSREEFLTVDLASITENKLRRQKYIKELLANQQNGQLEIVQFRKDGSRMYLEVNASLVEYHSQSVILSIRRDITSRIKDQEKLRYAALHDSLTNLPNRTMFLTRLKHALSTIKRNPKFVFSVIFFDLDNFKNINDVFGHSEGDKYIQALSLVIKKALRDTDMLARFGGDEFVILLEGYEDHQISIHVCKRILEIVNTPLKTTSHHFSSTASMGVVNGNPGYTSAEEIIRDADIAMYKAKEKGGNAIEIFDDHMRDMLIKQLEVERDLEFALERNEFTLFYQPIVSLYDGSIFGLEALLRWKKPGRKVLPPSKFIPIIEKTGLINSIGDWVLNEAIDRMIEWKNCYRNLNNLSLSVNISSVQLEHLRFSDNLLKRLNKSKLDTGSLSIEVTESTIIQNIDTTSEVLDTLKKHGIQIFLDDFGTGYSSLNYLGNLPISILKIDRTFISNMTKTRRLNLLTSMINLGHELGMQVVAEGIETRAQLTLLRSLGCDFGQGYFLQRPVNAQTISKLLSVGKIKL